MENLKYSILLGNSSLFVLGVICLLVSGSIKIRELDNKFKNKVAYYCFGIGRLVVFASIYETLNYIFREFVTTLILRNFLLFLSPFVSFILSVWLSNVMGMWVHWKNPNAEFPPLRDKQVVTAGEPIDD